MALAQEITRALKRHDRDLFCQFSPVHGCDVVYRRSRRLERVWETAEFSLSVPRETKEYVLALTSDWNHTSEPRAWGLDRILEKIRSMDHALNSQLFEEFEERERQLKKSKRRHLDNEVEAWAKDSRRAFGKMADESFGCVHSLDKSEQKRRKRDRRIKDGDY